MRPAKLLALPPGGSIRSCGAIGWRVTSLKSLPLAGGVTHICGASLRLPPHSEWKTESLSLIGEPESGNVAASGELFAALYHE
jgi:hypothetical protein